MQIFLSAENVPMDAILVVARDKRSAIKGHTFRLNY